VATSSNVTQNDISITKSAQEAFQTAASDLTSILRGVEGTNDLLIQAMQGQAGPVYNKALAGWMDDFNDLQGTMQSIADQLGDQWQQMMSNDQHNTDLAYGVAQVSLP
jgi:uncharacterized protein YukE